MGLFSDVFNKSTVYESLFFNIKAVLIYPTLDKMKVENMPMYERWMFLASTKYGDINVSEEYSQIKYEDKAILFPEFTRIVAITYATLYAKDGKLERYFKRIANDDEVIVITAFMDVLRALSSDGMQSTPYKFPILCGHNIIANDIPLLVKRFVINRDKIANDVTLPYILKRALDTKPWESGIIDTVNVWKFNGFMNGSLMLIADYMGLKKKVDLDTNADISRYYWRNIELEDTEKTLEYISLQSATQTNLVIQLMNELRQL